MTQRRTPERHPDARDLEPGQEEPEPTGDCFEAAALWMLDHAHEKLYTRLVHAVVLLGAGPCAGLPYGHAWVEFDIKAPLPPGLDPSPTGRTWTIRLALDTSNGRNIEVPAAFYRFCGGAVQVREYTRVEMLVKMAESRHYGPWDLEVSR